MAIILLAWAGPFWAFWELQSLSLGVDTHSIVILYYEKWESD